MATEQVQKEQGTLQQPDRALSVRRLKSRRLEPAVFTLDDVPAPAGTQAVRFESGRFDQGFGRIPLAQAARTGGNAVTLQPRPLTYVAFMVQLTRTN